MRYLYTLMKKFDLQFYKIFYKILYTLMKKNGIIVKTLWIYREALFLISTILLPISMCWCKTTNFWFENIYNI